MRSSTLDEMLTSGERELLHRLDSPAKIQAYLDATPYAAEYRNRSSINILRDRYAHCLDGALFGAMALRRLGFPPMVVDMFPDPGMDDDHVLAIYRVDGRYGAVAKSNFSGLRMREPVYRDLRELVMSYFEDFYNVNGLRTLRTYTRPMNLTAYDRYGWEYSDSGVDKIEKKLLELNCIPLITPEMAARLNPLDQLSYQAGMLGTNIKGVYQPKG